MTDSHTQESDDDRAVVRAAQDDLRQGLRDQHAYRSGAIVGLRSDLNVIRGSSVPSSTANQIIHHFTISWRKSATLVAGHSREPSHTEGKSHGYQDRTH